MEDINLVALCGKNFLSYSPRRKSLAQMGIQSKLNTAKK